MASPYSEPDHARREDESKRTQKVTDDWMEKRTASWRALHPTTTMGTSSPSAAPSSSASSLAGGSALSRATALPTPFIPGLARLLHDNLIFTSAAPRCGCGIDRQALLKDSATASTPSCSSCCLHDLPALGLSIAGIIKQELQGHAQTTESVQAIIEAWREKQRLGAADEQPKPALRHPLRTSLDAFLDKYKPSVVHSGQASWIYVKAAAPAAPAPAFGKAAGASSSSSSEEEDEWRDGYDEDRLEAEWAASPSKTAATLETLARRSGFLTGKWMLFRENSAVDDVWRRVAFAIVRGLLPGVSTAKVSTHNDDPSHVICVYTRDWTNRQELMRVRQALRDVCGVHLKISYKADIYTILGVYAKNPWNIKPSICAE